MNNADRIFVEQFEKELQLSLDKICRLNSMSWDEISEEVDNGNSGETIRKKAYGYRDYNKYLRLTGKLNSSKEEYEKLIKKELDIKKKLSELADMRTLVNKEIREQQRYENLIKLLKDNILPYNDHDAYYMKTDSMYDEISSKEMIISLSDLHYGLDFKSEWNTYNSDVARNRMSYIINKSIKIGMDNNVRLVHLVVNGDLVNGNIHLTSRLSNRETISKQVSGVSDLISQAIKILSNSFEYVEVHLNSGNHDRICPSKHDNDYDDSYINIIKDYVIIKTENLKNVIIDENKYGHDISVFNCCGKNIVAAHGDKISTKDLIPRLTTLFGDIDYVLRGHVHNDQLASFGKGKVITTPSFSGMDRYALEHGLYSRPEQKIIVLEDNSNESMIYNVDLSKIGE